MPRYIDADMILTKFDKVLQLAGNDGAIAALKFCKEIVQKAPTISPDEVRGVGKWTRHEHDGQFWANYCSVCFTYLPPGTDWKPNYCPSCGAKMEVSEDD